MLKQSVPVRKKIKAKAFELENSVISAAGLFLISYIGYLKVRISAILMFNVLSKRLFVLLVTGEPFEKLFFVFTRY